MVPCNALAIYVCDDGMVASILTELEAPATDTRNLALSIQREAEEARGHVNTDAAA
jgi:hypothetical protein